MRVKPAIIGAAIAGKIHEGALGLVATVDDVASVRGYGRSRFACCSFCVGFCFELCANRVLCRNSGCNFGRDSGRCFGRDFLRPLVRPLGFAHRFMAIQKIFEDESKSFIEIQVALLFARHQGLCFFQKLKHFGRDLQILLSCRPAVTETRDLVIGFALGMIGSEFNEFLCVLLR